MKTSELPAIIKRDLDWILREHKRKGHDNISILYIPYYHYSEKHAFYIIIKKGEGGDNGIRLHERND